MRVLVIGPSWIDSFEMGCVRGFHALGHEAEVFDMRQHLGVPRPLQRYPMSFLVAEYLLRSTVREPYYLAQRKLLARARELRPDLVLVIQLLWVFPETIAELRDRLGARCVGWFPDAFTSFGRASFLLAPWDALFFSDILMVNQLRQGLGVDTIYELAQCCDPAYHRPVPLTQEDHQRYDADVATFGNYYPYRARMLEPLLDGSLKLKLWGARPPRWLRHKVSDFWSGAVVLGDDKCKAMLAAKIALNTNHYAGFGINKRTFELSGIGAFQLVDERPSLGQYFEIGEEIATFKGHADLREKVEHYLARPEERQRIARRAQERAHREHTFKDRLATLLATIKMGDMGATHHTGPAGGHPVSAAAAPAKGR